MHSSHYNSPIQYSSRELLQTSWSSLTFSSIKTTCVYTLIETICLWILEIWPSVYEVYASKVILRQVQDLIKNYKAYQSLASSMVKEQMPSSQVDTDDFLQLLQWAPVLLSTAELEQIQGLQQNIQSQSKIYTNASLSEKSE